MITITVDDDRPTRAGRDRLAFGLVLIVLGLVLTLEQTGYWAVGGLHRLWPLFIVGMGLARLLAPARRGEGLTTLSTGLIFLAHTFDVARLHQTWPLFLVLVGASILMRGRGASCARRPAPERQP